MSGTWRARVEAGEPLKPADVGAGLRELLAGMDRAFAALEDARSDIAGLTARLVELEPKPEPRPARRGKADE